MAANAVAAAPWRPQFVNHLSKLPAPEFVLTTVHRPSSASPPLPRARYCIMRGFWADLPENKHNEAPQNPAVYSSDLLTFTTDARMEKYEDLSRDGVEKGGDVEAIFWIKDVMRQWRIRGRAYVIGGGEEKEKELRDELEKRMRKTGDGEWSWEKEITAHWGNLSPSMRGSFKNPPPGMPKSKPVNDPELKLGQKVNDEHDPIGRKNFRVVIIQPEEVEELDLTDPAEARRWKWTYVGDGDSAAQPNGKQVHKEWKMEELWP